MKSSVGFVMVFLASHCESSFTIIRTPDVLNVAQPLVITAYLFIDQAIISSYEDVVMLKIDGEIVCKFQFTITTCSVQQDSCTCQLNNNMFFSYVNTDISVNAEEFEFSLDAKKTSTKGQIQTLATLPLMYRAFIAHGLDSKKMLSSGTEVSVEKGSNINISLELPAKGSTVNNKYVLSVAMRESVYTNTHYNPSLTFSAPSGNTTAEFSLKRPSLFGGEGIVDTFNFTMIELTAINPPITESSLNTTDTTAYTMTTEGNTNINIIIGWSVATAVLGMIIATLIYCFLKAKYKQRRAPEPSNLDTSHKTSRSESERFQPNDDVVVDSRADGSGSNDSATSGDKTINDSRSINSGSNDSKRTDYKSTDTTDSVTTASSRNSFQQFMHEVRRHLRRQSVRYLDTSDVTKPPASSTLDGGGHLKLYVPTGRAPDNMRTLESGIPGEANGSVKTSPNKGVPKDDASKESSV